MNRKFKDKSFSIFLLLTIATIPFPMYILNSMSLIGLFISWLFYDSMSNKILLLKKSKKLFLILIIPFLLILFGLLYSNNWNGAFREVTLKLPFLLIPLIIISVNWRKENFNYLMKHFCIATTIATLLAFTKSVYFKFNNLGNYLYYSYLENFIEKHTTYYSLFIVISILYIINEIMIKKTKSRWLLFALLINSCFLYFLSVRISIFALVFGLSYLLIVTKKDKSIAYIVLRLILAIGVIFIIFKTPNFVERFQPSKTETKILSDSNYRELHWKSVLKTVKSNILFGIGTSSNRTELFNNYLSNGLTSAYNDKYNAHNQYLEFLLEYGLLGLSLFLFFLIKIFLIIRQNTFYVACFIVFLIYMLTESILERTSGIVLFSLLITLQIKSSLYGKI